MSRYIIGVHSGHDSSACLFCDTKLIMAIEKERITRVKHDSGEPIECIEYLLQANELKYSDIDLVIRVNWYNAIGLNDDYYRNFKNVIVKNSHHIFHAYAVTVTMDEPGLIYIIDGRGCRPKDNGEKDDREIFETESLYYYDGKNELISLEKIYKKHLDNAYNWGSHMDSVGYIYADVSRMIFKDYNAAGKVMALASYGVENDIIPTIMQYNGRELTISQKWLDFLNSQPFPLNYNSQIAKDIAYSLQKEVEIYIERRVKNFIKNYKYNVIGLGGGVALNCKNNGNILNQCSLESLYLFPACGDNGIAVGAAVWGIKHFYKDSQKLTWKYDLGKKYEQYHYFNNDIVEISAMIHQGEVIGLYENGSEFGPRALCNRSLLASPYHKGIKKYLNTEIKHREDFRPFGGVILERNISKITSEHITNDHMLIAVNAKKEIRDKIPDLVHKDGTVRLQIIRESQKNTSIYKILELMEKKYGEWILINTSFNGKDEPIVETVIEAKNTAKKIGIKHILLNGMIERIER